MRFYINYRFILWVSYSYYIKKCEVFHESRLLRFLFAYTKYANKCLEDKFLQTTKAAFAGKYFHKQKCQVSLLNSGEPKFKILYYLEIAIHVCSKITIKPKKIIKTFKIFGDFCSELASMFSLAQAALFLA